MLAGVPSVRMRFSRIETVPQCICRFPYNRASKINWNKVTFCTKPSEHDKFNSVQFQTIEKFERTHWKQHKRVNKLIFNYPSGREPEGATRCSSPVSRQRDHQLHLRVHTRSRYLFRDSTGQVEAITVSVHQKCSISIPWWNRLAKGRTATEVTFGIIVC